MTHLQPNTTLQGGRYRIECVLGQGGFGVTYLAIQISSNRKVAIKELFLNGVNERLGNSIQVSNSVNDSLFEKQKEKFKKEAKRIMSLDNEHIVKVYDLFEENNTEYYVMDYLEGESLASKMKREGHPLTESEVMDILPQLLDALSEIHKYQIWHLDIKPANIMLIDKNVVLIDFGASKQITPSEMTSTALYFTPGYAPAEQTGMLFNQFGPWTDLYAVGATIFNLLTGKSPLEFDIEEFKEDDLPESNMGLMYKMINWMMQPRRKERPQKAIDVKQKYYVDLVSIGVISISKEVLQKEIVKVKGEDIDLVKDLGATKKQIEKIQKEIKDLFGVDVEGYPMTHDCIVVAILQQLGWLFDIGNEESDEAADEEGEELENLVKEQNKILEERDEETVISEEDKREINMTVQEMVALINSDNKKGLETVREIANSGKMNIWGLLCNILPFVLPYRWLIGVTLVLTLVGSLMAQVNAVVLDRAVDAINALVQQPDGFQWSAAVRILTVISVILLGKEVVGAVVTFFQRYYGERMRILVSRDLSLRVVDRILSFRMAFFSGEGNETGKLQSRIDRGIMSLSNTVNNFFIEILPLFTSAILALVLMFAANVYVGLVALCIVPIYFWVTNIQAARMKGGRRGIFGSHQAVSQGILNIIESITVIKSFNREEIEAARQAAIQQSMTGLQLSTRRKSFFFNGLKSFLEQIGTVLIIILTAYLVLIDYPGMSIGKIMYHVMLFANVSAPIRQLHRIYDDMNDALIYAEGFFGILHADDEVETRGSHRPETVKGDFVMSGVHFTYPGGTKALTDVSMHIPAGKITALVGLSGAGKSTIVNLLDKFYIQQEGTITLDGTELQQWDTQWLRENVGLVLQKNHIFDGTIEENIRYGNPSATTADVEEAARKAFIYDQVVQLPRGFQTPALQLSGGQQQRIAIARMFLKNPPIIFLDEPTASLDAIATEQIKASIDAIKQGRTVIIISHNIGQIIDADQIYVLQQGHVVQGGSPSQVYAQGGLYKDIFDASARSMNIDKIAHTIEGGQEGK